jgi:hypothetical protein
MPARKMKKLQRVPPLGETVSKSTLDDLGCINLVTNKTCDGALGCNGAKTIGGTHFQVVTQQHTTPESSRHAAHVAHGMHQDTQWVVDVGKTGGEGSVLFHDVSTLARGFSQLTQPTEAMESAGSTACRLKVMLQ